MNSVGLQFLIDLGRRITQVSTDQRESAFLFRRLSVLIQRFSVLMQSLYVALLPTRPLRMISSRSSLAFTSFSLVLTLGIYNTEGTNFFVQK